MLFNATGFVGSRDNIFNITLAYHQQYSDSSLKLDHIVHGLVDDLCLKEVNTTSGNAML